MCYREPSPLADALIDQQLSEKAWRVPRRTAWGDFGGCGCPFPRMSGKFELQVHVFLESPDVDLGIRSGELVGRILRCHILDVSSDTLP